MGLGRGGEALDETRFKSQLSYWQAVWLVKLHKLIQRQGSDLYDGVIMVL